MRCESRRESDGGGVCVRVCVGVCSGVCVGVCVGVGRAADVAGVLSPPAGIHDEGRRLRLRRP